MASKTSDKPDKAPAQKNEGLSLGKQLRMGMKPDNGGSYAKGKQTPA